jgi:hypothetical protein
MIKINLIYIVKKLILEDKNFKDYLLLKIFFSTNLLRTKNNKKSIILNFLEKLKENIGSEQFDLHLEKSFCNILLNDKNNEINIIETKRRLIFEIVTFILKFGINNCSKISIEYFIQFLKFGINNCSKISIEYFIIYFKKKLKILLNLLFYVKKNKIQMKIYLQKIYLN